MAQKTMHKKHRFNVPGGVLSFIWLLVVLVPIYYVVVNSFAQQSEYGLGNPLAIPHPFTFSNYQAVISPTTPNTPGIVMYFRNSVIVTLGTELIVLVVAVMASYVIVRNTSRLVQRVFSLFMLGLAIPAQAVIVPLFLIITKTHLYDTFWALILPGVAFGIPLTVLILVNFMRDIPTELYDSMRVDGAGHLKVLWRLVVPLSVPAIITVGIYGSLQTWNSFLFPLILTQSANKMVLPMAVWQFQGEFTSNTPAILATVVLSAVPMLAAYIFGRRWLVAGLTAGFSK